MRLLIAARLLVLTSMTAGAAAASEHTWTVVRGEDSSCTIRTAIGRDEGAGDFRIVMSKVGKITIELRRSAWTIRPKSLANVNLWFGEPGARPGDLSSFWFSLKSDVTGLEGEADDAFLDRLAASKSLTIREAALNIDETIDTAGAAASIDRLRACAG